MATPYAFVTLLTSDSYLPGALTVAAALRDVHTTPPTPPEVDFHTVCLVTPETVDVSSIKLLRRAFNVVIGVEIIEENNARGLHLLGECSAISRLETLSRNAITPVLPPFVCRCAVDIMLVRRMNTAQTRDRPRARHMTVCVSCGRVQWPLITIPAVVVRFIYAKMGNIVTLYETPMLTCYPQPR